MIKQDPKTIIDITQDPTLINGSPVIFQKKQDRIHIPRYHWKPDKEDTRDYRYEVSQKVQENLIDLRPFCSMVEDQGNLGSCTGQAIAGAIELLNKRNNKPTDVSRLFIYYYERLMLGTVNYDSGAYIRDGIKSCFKNGAPLEKFWPYIIQKFKNKPSVQAVRDGLTRKITLYERVNDHQGCLDALSNGYPVIVGFYVFSSFESLQVYKTGMMPYPDVMRERFLGGHAVLLVGYNKETKRYIARNSWGKNWGDNGYFYMPFEVIENSKMSEDFWIIKSVKNP